MEDIRIVPLGHDHLAQADGWPRNSGQTLLKLPSSAASGADLTGWSALSGDQLVGLVFVTFSQTKVGYLEVRVKPTAARQGIGLKLTDYALSQPPVQAINHLHALVDLDNVAAQKILDQHKFSRIGYSPDGRIEYARHP